MSPERFWMFEWLEQYGIVDRDSAVRTFQDRRAVRTLQRLATEHSRRSVNGPLLDNAIVAGTGLDLSGNLSCSELQCRTAQVDQLFRRAWFYFDRIVVDDPFTHRIVGHWSTTSTGKGLEQFLNSIVVLTELRNIGADSLVNFVDKGELRRATNNPSPSKKSISKVVNLLNDDAIIESLESRLSLLSRNAGIGQSSRYAYYSLMHPLLETVTTVRVPRDVDLRRDRIKRYMLEDAASHHLLALSDDVTTASRLGIPLAATNLLHHKIMSTSQEEHLAAVLFSLELPVLMNVPIPALIELRTEERESFELFRSTLRAAVKERLALPASSPVEHLAKEIHDDVIKPELDRINVRLRASARSLERKGAVAIAGAALTTAVGFVAGLGPLALAGVAASAAFSQPALQTYFDSKQEVEMSDMFFLWKAAQLSHKER